MISSISVPAILQSEDVPQLVFPAPLFLLPGGLVTERAPDLQVLQEVPHADKLSPAAQHADSQTDTQSEMLAA